MAHRNRGLKGNLDYLYKELVEVKPELEAVIVTSRTYPGKISWMSFSGQMFTVYYYLATARIFILEDLYLPLHFIKVRKGTEVIQLWQATGPLKKVGLGALDTPSERSPKLVAEHSNYDKVIVNSDIEIDIYAEVFGMPREKILPLGSPRTDILFKSIHNTNKKEKFIEAHPTLKGKELILYAPAYREGTNAISLFISDLDFKKMNSLLIENNKVILFNMCWYMTGNIEWINKMDGNAFFLNRDEYMIEDLLMISDALISDDHSVVSDYSILEKPIAMNYYDYEQYNDQCGLDSGLIKTFIEQEKELLAWIISDTKDTVGVKKLKQRTFKYQDGHASKRITDSLF